jgi:hypothetical protein
MGVCYWCYWGWPKPIRDIYDDCVNQLGSDSSLMYGPSHIVWADENWDCAQWCLDHFDEHKGRCTDEALAVVRESLERLLKVPDEFKSEPGGFKDEDDPADFPPPEHWECEKR